MNLKNNLSLIYIISSLMWVRFFIPVLALFYIASQVPLEQFAVIMSVFALATLILEIPSGVVADLIGRKKVLLLARFLYIIEIFLIAFYNGFWVFLIAKIISGIGVSLSSGANEALLYDTLKRLNKEQEHKRISGKIFMITNISTAFVFIIGAFLFSINNKLPAVASLPFISLGFVLTFFLKEPYAINHRVNLRNAYLHLKTGLIYFLHHDYVKFLVFFSIPIASGISIILSISSAYFEKIMIPVALIGIFAFISSMITAYFSKKAHRFEKRLGDKKSLYLIQALVVAGIFLMSLMINYFGVIFYFLIPLSSGFFGVLINHYMNSHIETSHRATMLSIKNLADNLGIFILFLAVGYMTKIRSMQTSLAILGIIFVIYSVILFLYSKRLRISQICK